MLDKELNSVLGPSDETNVYAYLSEIKTVVANQTIVSSAELVINCDAAIDYVMGSGSVMSIFTKGMKYKPCLTVKDYGEVITKNVARTDFNKALPELNTQYNSGKRPEDRVDVKNIVYYGGASFIKYKDWVYNGMILVDKN